VTPPKFKLRYLDELDEKEKEKTLGEVFFRAREQNLLTSIIAKQIQDKYDSGWLLKISPNRSIRAMNGAVKPMVWWGRWDSFPRLGGNIDELVALSLFA
jgi:hypothetical protein